MTTKRDKSVILRDIELKERQLNAELDRDTLCITNRAHNLEQELKELEKELREPSSEKMSVAEAAQVLLNNLKPTKPPAKTGYHIGHVYVGHAAKQYLEEIMREAESNDTQY